MKNDVPHSLRAKKKVGGRTRRQSRAKLRSKVPLISVSLWVTKAAIVICLRWRSLATQIFPDFSLVEATTTLKIGGMCLRPFFTERLKGLWNWRMPRTHRSRNILNLWCLSRGVTTSTLLFQHLILKKNYEKPAKKIKAEEAKESKEVPIDV